MWLASYELKNGKMFKSKISQHFLIETRYLAESAEGLNSSLAPSLGKLDSGNMN